MKNVWRIIMLFVWACSAAAQPTLPAPVTLETRLTDTQQKITDILIPVSEDTQTAVFQRNGYTYVILNQKTISDVLPLDTPAVRSMRQIPSETGTILQFLPATDYHWFVNRRGRYLILSLSLEPQEDKVIPIYPQKEKNALSFAVEPTSVFFMTDPVSGEKIYVFPLLLHEQKMQQRYAAQTFELPETDQGLVFISHVPDIHVDYKNKKLTISSPHDLLLNNDIAFAATDRNDVLDFSDLKQMNRAAFDKERNRLQDLIIAMPEPGKTPFRKALARLYLSQNFGQEALDRLNSIPPAYQDEETATLKVAALLTMGRFRTADAVMNTKTTPHPFWTTWREFVHNPKALSDTAFYGLYQELPTPLFLSLAFQALPALWEQGDIRRLSFLLSKIETFALTPYQKQAFFYYAGLVQRHHGQTREAQHLFQNALKETVLSPARAQSQYEFIRIGLEQKSIPVKDAIVSLENLRYTYREPSFEIALLETLNSLYRQEKEYTNALKTYRSLFILRRDTPKTDEMAALFQEAMLQSPNLSPLEKLALFYEFQELIPADETGNQIMMRLTDALIDLDLLDQAFDVSLSLANHRLTGQTKQDFYFKAALIALLNQNQTDVQTVLRFLQPETPYGRIVQAGGQALQQNKTVRGEKILSRKDVSFLHPTLINYLAQQGWLQ